MQHYAAIQINRDMAKKLADAINNCLERKFGPSHHEDYRGKDYHESLDILLHPDGFVSLEDDGIEEMVKGVVIDFHCPDGSENLLQWASLEEEVRNEQGNTNNG